LAKIDAVTISMSELVKSGDITVELGRNAIVLGLVTSALFKSFIVLMIGSKKLFVRVAPIMIASAAAAPIILLIV